MANMKSCTAFALMKVKNTLSFREWLLLTGASALELHWGLCPKLRYRLADCGV